jgi:carbon-monoxide dehydrogenase medium subunit
MQEFDFYAARTLDELCRILAETGGRVIAGGTDVLVQMQRGVFPADCLVDASRVAELRFIREENGWIQIGALTTYADLLASPLLRQTAPLLLEAAALVGAPQTRCRGTLGGNIANASPAGDTLPPLLALNAKIRLVSQYGERTLPLADVLRGPGKTCLERGEVIHSISFARLAEPAGMVFLKLGNRHGMCISVVSVAAALVVDGRITDARIALGAVAPTAVRSSHAEAVLAGQVSGPQVFQRSARAVLDDIAPISDVRGTAAYRRQAAERLVRRALELAVERAGGGVPA